MRILILFANHKDLERILQAGVVMAGRELISEIQHNRIITKDGDEYIYAVVPVRLDDDELRGFGRTFDDIDTSHLRDRVEEMLRREYARIRLLYETKGKNIFLPYGNID